MLLAAAVALSCVSGALAQTASTTSDGLANFIGVANSAVGIINSANAQQTATSSPSSSSAIPTTSTQPAAASSSAAPPPHHSNSHRTLIITIVCCIVGALLLIAAIFTIVCCCLARRRRRHRKQAIVPVEDGEKTNYHSPTASFNPSGTYAPLHIQDRNPSMEQQPTVPILAATATHGTHQHQGQHPQNPFIPLPPSPRRGIYSSNDNTPYESHTPPVFTATTTTVTNPHPENQPLRPASYSSSTLPTQPLRPISHSPSTLPTQPTADPPLTPFGLSGIGHPYEDMHVHVLQNEKPSSELRNSLSNREPILRYTPAPRIPSRSPHRHSGSFTPADSSYHSVSEGSSTTNGSGSGEEWRRSRHIPYPEQQQRHQRYSDIAAANVLPAPPVPWTGSSSQRNSPRNSLNTSIAPPSPRQQQHERRGSRSPATSVNGQPRRLRFSDVQAANGNGNGNGNGRGSNGYDGWDERHYAHGVGEAL